MLSTVYGRQWLADALKENDPSSVLLFLVGSKKDLSVSVPVVGEDFTSRQGKPHAQHLTLTFLQTPAQYILMEKDALKVAQEMKAEYWAVSSLTGESEAPGLPACLASHSYTSSCAPRPGTTLELLSAPCVR